MPTGYPRNHPSYVNQPSKAQWKPNYGDAPKAKPIRGGKTWPPEQDSNLGWGFRLDHTMRYARGD